MSLVSSAVLAFTNRDVISPVFISFNLPFYLVCVTINLMSDTLVLFSFYSFSVNAL